jgi:hypothetical protein
MSVSNNFQLSNFESIPFMGSGKELTKKQIEVGKKVIIKKFSGEELSVSILSNNSYGYIGVIKDGSKVEFTKENVFLIL